MKKCLPALVLAVGVGAGAAPDAVVAAGGPVALAAAWQRPVTGPTQLKCCLC